MSVCLSKGVNSSANSARNVKTSLSVFTRIFIILAGSGMIFVKKSEDSSAVVRFREGG